jgi:hypothetical protein
VVVEEDSTVLGAAVNTLEEPMEMAVKEERDLFKVELVVVPG